MTAYIKGILEEEQQVINGAISPDATVSGNISAEKTIGGTLSSSTQKITGNISSTKTMTGKLSGTQHIGGKLSSDFNMMGKLSSLGIKGDSAYDLAVKSGYEGTLEEWLKSLKGEQVHIDIIESLDGFKIKFTTVDGEVITPEITTKIDVDLGDFTLSPISMEQIDEILERSCLNE